MFPGALEALECFVSMQDHPPTICAGNGGLVGQHDVHFKRKFVSNDETSATCSRQCASIL